MSLCHPARTLNSQRGVGEATQGFTTRRCHGVASKEMAAARSSAGAGARERGLKGANSSWEQKRGTHHTPERILSFSESRDIH